MLTKSDLQRLEKTFVTKEEFHNSHDTLITKLDAIMGELQDMREETTVFNYRQSNHGDRIENLELKTFGKSFA